MGNRPVRKPNPFQGVKAQGKAGSGVKKPFTLTEYAVRQIVQRNKATEDMIKEMKRQGLIK